MKYFNVIVTHVTDCVIQAEDEDQALQIASDLYSGDAEFYESECICEIDNNQLDSYKRNANYIDEVG